MLQGFMAAGIDAGIKKEGKDLGLIFSEVPCMTAAVFTQNRVKAAPVLLDMERVSRGVCRAVIANSGCANCCTGEQGYEDAVETTRTVARILHMEEAEVLAASTGVIGQPLPVKKIVDSVPELVKRLSARGFDDFAESIMTTDTFPKIATRTESGKDGTYNVMGIAKGAGMIRPDMATMLCFVCTDARLPADRLDKALRAAVDASFNRITVDGDTSTNDTVIALANGLSGIDAGTGHNFDVFCGHLTGLLSELARQIVKDGEGATRCVTMEVTGAPVKDDARAVAYSIADSPLVKTALFGCDPNWGRILAAAGKSGVRFDPASVSIWFEDVQVVKQGLGTGQEAERVAAEVMRRPEYRIRIDLGSGSASWWVLTCDLTVDYIKINADYRT